VTEINPSEFGSPGLVGQLMEISRLSALTELASGIAHDINNAISPVLLYTETLLERETLDSE